MFKSVKQVIKMKTLNRPLAQLVEQLAFNQFVEGSNPSRPTTFDYATSIENLKHIPCKIISL